MFYLIIFSIPCFFFFKICEKSINSWRNEEYSKKCFQKLKIIFSSTYNYTINSALSLICLKNVFNGKYRLFCKNNKIGIINEQTKNNEPVFNTNQILRGNHRTISKKLYFVRTKNLKKWFYKFVTLMKLQQIFDWMNKM